MHCGDLIWATGSDPRNLIAEGAVIAPEDLADVIRPLKELPCA